MKVFEKMLTLERREAFLNRKDKSFNITDDEFEELNKYIMSDECTSDITRLDSGDFFFSIPDMIRLRKGHSDKRRTIYRFPDKEKMLMKYMAFVLHDFDYLYSDSLFSFRLGKTVCEIFRDLTRLRCAETDWILKGDIKGFGDNVNPEILCSQLEEFFGQEDPKLVWFCKCLLLRGEFYERGELKKGSTGALSGCALTNFFENIYLLDVDEMIRKKATYYCRFADDIAVFLKSREDTDALYAELCNTFKERNLTFNMSKTEIVPPGGSFELLGFNVEGNVYDISDNSLGKIEWKLRHRAKKLVRMQRKGWITKEEAEQRMITRINNYFFKREADSHELNWVDWAFRVLTRSDSLKRLDSCAQSCIRYAGSGGKNTDSRYKVRYKDMRRKGYRTLVHAFYHRETLKEFEKKA
ncbi:MAG: hypothetical protein K6F55_09470 [Eubacterium sp.]|nr:hypothetical protein [Eubacterium sp.]